MFEYFLKSLTEELKSELPGEKVQVKMAPSIRNKMKSDSKSRNAGVLILIYPNNEEFFVAFIQRTQYNGPHSGQISFPGGKTEKTDKDIAETTLRESQEEIGIIPLNIQILGKLTPLHIPVSNFIVYPVVGVSENTPSFIADPIEVEKIIEIKLQDLINPKNCTSKEFKYGDLSFEAPIYNPDNLIIWGATAMILSEFIEIIRTIDFKFQE